MAEHSPDLDGDPAADTAADAGAAAPAKRSTRQRRALVAALEGSQEFRSAQDLHRELRDQGDAVGLATVYRGLQALVEAGEVDVVKPDGTEAAYRLCGRAQHHHHLVCRRCSRTVEVSGPAVEQWADEVARQHGYVAVDHTLELFGTCPDCARELAERADQDPAPAGRTRGRTD